MSDQALVNGVLLENKDDVLSYNFSEKHTEIIKSLINLQTNMDAASKDANNPHFGKKYADYKNVWDAVGPLINKNKMAYMLIPSGGPKFFSFTGMLMHECGEYLKCTVQIEASRISPQEFGSLSTYMKRYLLQLLTGVATDQDDDGNKATKKPDQKPLEKPAPPQQNKSNYKPPQNKPIQSQQNSIEAMFSAYQKRGVSIQDIVEYFGYKSKSQITEQDVNTLRNLWKSIMSGELSIEDLFIPPNISQVPISDLDFRAFEEEINPHPDELTAILEKESQIETKSVPNKADPIQRIAQERGIKV